MIGLACGLAWVGLAWAGVRPATTTGDALRVAFASRRVAVVVGVDTYADPALPALSDAGHDAAALGAIFEDPAAGGFDQVKQLTGTVDRGAVLDALRDQARDLRRDDVLVVYFSGHGTRIGDRRFLLASNSRPADLDGTALDLEALERWFSGLAPARKALVVDACFDGAGKSVLPPTAPPAAAPLAPPADALGSGEEFLFATTPGRPALEDDVLGHGIYTYYLVDALSWSFREADVDHDGVVTAWEAHDYARDRTIERSGGRQVPEAAIRVVGHADVVLVGTPTARADSDLALVYLYGPPTGPLSGGTLAVDGRVRGTLPGTIPVTPGRHWFELTDRSGARVAEGALRVRPGRPVAASDLAALLARPRLELAVGAGGRLGPGFGSAVGPAGGVELGVAVGWHALELGLRGAALGAGRPEHGVHPAGDVAARIGARLGHGAWLVDLGLGPGLAWMPPAGALPPEADPYQVPDQAGWLFATLGVDLRVGRALAHGRSVGVSLRPAVTEVDADGDGRAEGVGWVAAGIDVTWAR